MIFFFILKTVYCVYSLELPQEISTTGKIRKGNNCVVTCERIFFLHYALLLIALSQCVEFHLILRKKKEQDQEVQQFLNHEMIFFRVRIKYFCF